MIDGAKLDRFLGHPENNATGLILGDRDGTLVVHFLEPTRSIVSHARQDDSERIAARDSRD